MHVYGYIELHMSLWFMDCFRSFGLTVMYIRNLSFFNEKLSILWGILSVIYTCTPAFSYFLSCLFRSKFKKTGQVKHILILNVISAHPCHVLWGVKRTNYCKSILYIMHFKVSNWTSNYLFAIFTSNRVLLELLKWR